MTTLKSSKTALRDLSAIRTYPDPQIPKSRSYLCNHEVLHRAVRVKNIQDHQIYQNIPSEKVLCIFKIFDFSSIFDLENFFENWPF